MRIDRLRSTLVPGMYVPLTRSFPAPSSRITLLYGFIEPAGFLRCSDATKACLRAVVFTSGQHAPNGSLPRDINANFVSDAIEW